VAKAPVGPTAGRRQAGKPAVAHASIQAAHGPRALQGAMSIPIEQIAPDLDQPRRAMDDEGLRALAASLMEYGVLQPLLVREDGYLADERARYRIIAGGRRYAAALLAGLARLPVVVRETEGAALRITQLIENIQRQDLAPLEEARAYKEIIDAEGISAEALGGRLHISGQQVRERLRLLEDQVLADAVERGQISATVARDIMRLPDDEIARVRVRVLAGERLQSNDIAAARARLDAAGVTNPRRKGGGRPAREAPTKAAPAPEMQRQGVRDQASLDAPPAQELAREALPPTDQASLDPSAAAGRDSGPPMAVPDSTGPAAQVRDDASAPGDGTGDSYGTKLGDASIVAGLLLHRFREAPPSLRDMDEVLTYRRGDPEWQRFFVEKLHLRIRHLLGEDVNARPERPEIARS